jgi:UDP-glucose:(heptosyl)LPS alpha-1,3-glucosyltransferase
VVAISALGRAEIRRLYGTPEAAVHLIYNGVDLTRFHPDNRPRLGPEVRRRLGLGAGHFVVAFVGSGFQRKGLDLAIEALALCRDPDLRLLVAGRGDAAPYREQAGRLGLGERVLWLGPEPRVEEVYAAADLLALPARYEPFGNVHLEALASGVPVLSSRAAGGAEVIESGLNGWVVAELTPAAVAEGLRALREADAAGLAARARTAAEPFTHDRQVEALGRLYRTLAS